MNQESPISILPVTDIPFPRVDFDAIVNPLPAIMAAPEFDETTKFFMSSPAASRSLLPGTAQALLYSVIRNIRPQHVVEIGTYWGGTTEALSRALHANGQGTVHTVSPFDAPHFVPSLKQWPHELQQRVRFHPLDSMAFFMEIDKEKIRPDLILIDGDHRFEFANFDLQASAERLLPGGFIFIDNVGQVGPYRAVSEFSKIHPEWHNCVVGNFPTDETKAYDGNRTKIPGTEFIVLRAPRNHFIGKFPKTFGETAWKDGNLDGIRLSLSDLNETGKLHIQCILRGFGRSHIKEVFASVTVTIDGSTREVEAKLDQPIRLQGDFYLYHVEPWFIWTGNAPLSLTTIPAPF